MKRQQTITKAPDIKLVEFYCNKCRKDFEGVGFKDTFEVDGVPCGRYMGKCKKKHKVIRFITDTQADPYFLESKKVWAERKENEVDLIQKSDVRYKKIYG